MLEGDESIHILGIGGVGISALARFLRLRGFTVSGSEVRRTLATESLIEGGVEVHIGPAPRHLEGVDLVVVPPETAEDHVELIGARKRGIPVIHRAEMIAELLPGYRTIGVTGTHGKGTVAAILAWILKCAGLEPGFIIGGWLNNFGTNARLGGGDWLVVEIDESDGTQHHIDCDYVICNFLELDHLNFYEGLEDIIESMVKFLESNDLLKESFVNLDSTGNRELVERAALRPTGYAQTHRAEFRAEITGPEQLPIPFRAFHRDEVIGDFELNLPGRYNVVNALGALAVAWRIGVSEEVISSSLRTFEGLKDRYSIARGGGVTVVKDFTSHPTGIGRVLESARDMAEGRLISVFKPYQYLMIRSLQDEYAAAFEKSDEVIVTKIADAGEDPVPGIGAETLVEKIRAHGEKVTYLPEEDQIKEYLLEILEAGDKVVFFGGADMLMQADHLQAELARRAGESPAGEEQPRLDGPLAEGRD